MLHAVEHRSSEDLWPVTEIVVRLRDRSPVRAQLPFNQDLSVLRVQLCVSLGLASTCDFRFPSYCPAEQGCPLHVFLHVPSILDPWNDPEHSPEQIWALVDVRRCVRPPRPSYLMLALPASFSLTWLREQLHALMPEQSLVHAAFIGTDPVLTYCVPDCITPLITVFPRTNCQQAVPGLVDNVIHTRRLTALRSGLGVLDSLRPFHALCRVCQHQAEATCKQHAPHKGIRLLVLCSCSPCQMKMNMSTMMRLLPRYVRIVCLYSVVYHVTIVRSASIQSPPNVWALQAEVLCTFPSMYP